MSQFTIGAPRYDILIWNDLISRKDDIDQGDRQEHKQINLLFNTGSGWLLKLNYEVFIKSCRQRRAFSVGTGRGHQTSRLSWRTPLKIVLAMLRNGLGRSSGELLMSDSDMIVLAWFPPKFGYSKKMTDNALHNFLKL